MLQAIDIAVKEEFLQGEAGKLFVRSWHSDKKPRAALAIIPGFNAHSGYYLRAGQAFANLGLSVHALDLRGRGKSEGERFYVEKFEDYADDVDRLVQEIRKREPGLPIYLLGHSAGGVTACLYALDHQQELAGLICESFAYQTPAPDVALAILKGLSHLAPHLHVVKLNNSDFTRDPKALEQMNADPLIKDEKQPTETMAAIVRADERLKENLSKITLPLLILHGTKDNAAKYSGSEHFHKEAASKDKTLKLYEGHYHDLLNDLGKEQVMEDVKEWLLERMPQD